MRKLFLFVLMFLFIVTPVFARSPIPVISGDNLEQYLFAFYGGGDGQEGWYSARADITDMDPGFLIDSLTILPNLEPSAVYIWTRVRGNVYDDIPSQADDYYVGVEWALADPLPDLDLYVATEKILFTTGTGIDHYYTGLGLRWTGSEWASCDFGIWTNMDRAHRFTTTVELTPFPENEFTIAGTLWYIVDDELYDPNLDGWGWWRVTADYPVEDDMSIVGLYEETTRTDPVFMLGFRYTL